MPSSTSRRASFDRGLLTVLFAGIVGTPLLWLAALQAGYVLAYQACDARSIGWVLIPMAATVALMIGLGMLSIAGHRRAARQRPPLALLGRVALAMAGLFTLVAVATAIPTLILHACD
jgi:hypothetical protein